MHGVAVARFHLWANLKAVCRLDVGMRSWNRLLGRLRNELEPTPQQRAAKQLSLAAGWLADCLSGYYAGADRRIVLPGVV